MGGPGSQRRLLVAVALAIAGGAGCGLVPSQPARVVTTVEQMRRLSPKQVYAGVQAHLRGVVTHAFVSDDVCFIQDGTGGVRIQLRQGQMLAEIGQQMEVWGTVASGGETPTLSDPSFKLPGKASLPAPETFDATGKVHQQLYRLVTVTGVVQSTADVHNDVTALQILSGSVPIGIRALSPTFSDPDTLVDAEIRIDGVLVAIPGSGDVDSVMIWAPSLSQVVVVHAAPSPRTSPMRTIASLRGLKGPQLPEHRVRLRGRLEANASGGLSIVDASGSMKISPGLGGPSQPGGVRELAGFATVRNGELILANAVDTASAADPAAGLPVQDSARAIHNLSAAEAARRYPVKLRGVVTYSDSFNGILFVQDQSDGIFVSVDDPASGVLRPHDWLEITGETAPGSFAPSITRARFRILGHAPLPPPDRDPGEAIFQGQLDCRWIEMSGVIQSVAPGSRETVVQVLAGTHRFQARILAPVDEIAPLVNAEVRLRGAAGALFNDRRQMLGIVIYVPGREYVQLERAAPPDPFDLPLRSAETLLQFGSGSSMGHRVRLRGVVTASELTGPTFVMDATNSVTVKDHNEQRLKPGDLVDVVGFPTIGPYSPLLAGAVIRKTGSGRAPAPQAITAAQLLEGSYDAELVQVEGLLTDRTPRGDRIVLALTSGHIRFTAQLQAGNLPRVPQVGAQLRVAGICSLEVDDSREAVAPRSFDIRMRSPADLTIVKQPPWLTFERLLPIFVITLGVAGVALIWASRLRRRLHAQSDNLMQKTAQLEKEHQQTTRALCRAREAEVMEQAHKHVLELVARDEDLDSVLLRLAEAVEAHCIGVTCSIQLRLPGGQRISASPSVPPNWQQALAGIEIEDFCGAGVHRLNSLAPSPAWTAIADPALGGRVQRLCLAPIERESRVIGVVIAFLAGELVLRRSERDFLVSASKLATLAVERRALYDQLSYQAEHDELTGLENRAAMLAQLSREIGIAAATGGLLGVIYVDLDDFKGVNDTYGHVAGDAVLREVAQRMTARVRRSDAVARLGGDEFVIMVPGIGKWADAYRIASEIVADLSRPFSFGGHTLATGASAGVSLYPSDGEDAESLLKAADARMYRHKGDRRYTAKPEEVASQV